MFKNSIMNLPGMKEDVQGLSFVNITELANIVASFLFLVPLGCHLFKIQIKSVELLICQTCGTLRKNN